MKKQILSIVATLTLIIPMAIVGFAGLDGQVKVNIPFDFMVSGKLLQAGKYTVDRGNTSATLTIRGRDNNSVATFIVSDITDKGEPQARLVFRRYGNQYFLTQVFDGRSNRGQQLMKSKAEREAAKKRDIITQNLIEPEIVTIVSQSSK